MKKQNKYILAVYIGFILQLLTVIFSMLVCEKLSPLRFLSVNSKNFRLRRICAFDELSTKSDSFVVVLLVFIAINAIIEWFWINKNKA